MARSAAALAALDRAGAARLLGTLQHTSGNAAVQRLVAQASVQRACGCLGTCGSCSPVRATDDGPDAADQEPEPVVSRQAARGAGLSETRADIGLGLTSGTSQGIADAFRQLNGLNMADLLQMLYSLTLRPGLFEIAKANARRGGPRMALACDVVAMRVKGPPSGAQLRSLINRAQALPPDQRTTLFRFLGKNLVINVMGFDVDISYCQSDTWTDCVESIRIQLAWARESIAVYSSARGKGFVTAAQVEAYFSKQTGSTGAAATTSSDGIVTYNRPRLSACSPITYHGTVLHEEDHLARQQIQLLHLKDQAKVNAIWRTAHEDIKAQVSAIRVEIRYYEAAIKAVKKLNKLISGP
jgi:hypothetical protein